jgi:hypothetical protein
VDAVAWRPLAGSWSADKTRSFAVRDRDGSVSVRAVRKTLRQLGWKPMPVAQPEPLSEGDDRARRLAW